MRSATAIGRFGRVALISAGLVLAVAQPAAALSEIPQEDLPVPEDGADPDLIEREDLAPPPGTEPDVTETPPAAEGEEPPAAGMPVPLPDPITSPRDETQQPDDPDEVAGDEPMPEVLYDLSLLPEPVRDLREQIMAACLTGEIENLRALVGTGEDVTQLSFGDSGGDPIELLRSLSGDAGGQEILAILYEVLAADFVHLDPGEPTELYVWPYFFAVPLETLDPRQRVELFKLVTAGDYEDMKNFGAYIFYRAGISPEGRWVFFVAGD